MYLNKAEIISFREAKMGQNKRVEQTKRGNLGKL